jgi:hypothetical protein
MKTFISILLFGLLGFLGCSGSNDGTSTTSTFTGQATPVAPWAIIETPTPTYEWTPVSGATRYRLTVQDKNQDSTTQDTNETYIIDEWYTAEEAGCASEDGLCMVTPDIEVIGEHEFKVLACANQECGLWSETLNFELSEITVARFTDNGDGTVTDLKTMLMWFKDASVLNGYMYMEAVKACTMYPIWSFAGYKDWRLPSMPELMSLIDKSQSDPALPPGNPFVNVQERYWSTKELTGYENWHYIMNLDSGDWQFAYDYDEIVCGWPVRPGS